MCAPRSLLGLFLYLSLLQFFFFDPVSFVEPGNLLFCKVIWAVSFGEPCPLLLCVGVTGVCEPPCLAS